MREVALCVTYVVCLFSLYEGVIKSLIRKVEKMTNELYVIRDEVKVMRSELDVIRSQFFIEGGKE